MIAAAVALAVGVGVFAYLADRERETAESARTVADARRLAALSSSVRGDQLDLAALLAVESNRRSDEISTRGALLASIVTRPELREYVAQGIEAGDATILAGSALVAFGAGEGSVVIVDGRIAGDDARLHRSRCRRCRRSHPLRLRRADRRRRRR